MTDSVLPLGTTVPSWVSLCAKMAPLSSVILYMAPIPTVQEFSRRKLVGDLPLLPYTSMLSNSLIWLTYGLLISEPKLWASNIIGLTLSIYYFFSFARLAPPGAASLPGTLQQHIQGFVSILASVLWMAKSKKKEMLGMLGVAINMAMFGSPLSAMKTVLETKSSNSIPLPMTVATLLSCALWLITGIWEMKDPYIWLPSVVGIVFGLIQVGLKLAFAETATVSHRSPDLKSQTMVLKSKMQRAS